MACVFSEMTYGTYKATSAVPMYEVIPVTDATSLWALGRNSPAERHLSGEEGGDLCGSPTAELPSLRWVPTEQHRADALTKRNASLRDAFRRWAQDPVVVLTDAKSAEAGAENSTWQNPMLTKEKVNQCHCVESCHHVKLLA